MAQWPYRPIRGVFASAWSTTSQKVKNSTALDIVELVNGGSRAGENERAEELCRARGYAGIGGSDAHLTSHIAVALTKFEAKITDEGSLVDALLSKEFSPVWLADTVDCPES